MLNKQRTAEERNGDKMVKVGFMVKNPHYKKIILRVQDKNNYGVYKRPCRVCRKVTTGNDGTDKNRWGESVCTENSFVTQ